jgi:U3 small nucleolar RNA-associated protein 10
MVMQHAMGFPMGSSPVPAGFRELCQRDARFEPFSSTLFSPTAVDLDRDAKGPEANRKLDASVTVFLGLLADHLMLPAAMQALEFLVRRLK